MRMRAQLSVRAPRPDVAQSRAIIASRQISNSKLQNQLEDLGRSPLLARVTVSAMPLVRKRQREDGEKTVSFMSSLCHYQSIEGLPSLFQKGRYRVGPLHFEIM